MKLIFFLLVLLKIGTNPTEGLQVLYSSGQIILKYFFHSSYNSFEKVCCKFDPRGCFSFVNSRGGVAPLYVGRTFINNYNGEFEVRITDLSVLDAGVYRCSFTVYPYSYQYVTVKVSDLKYLSGVNATPLLPKSSIKPAVSMSSSPSTATVPEEPEKLSDDWGTSYTLVAVLSVLVFAVISMTLLVCRLKTRKKKSTEKSGTCGSANTTLEQNGIIYSMVEFKPHQDPFELYANLQIDSPGNTNPSSRFTFTRQESVEYSTILRAPA